MIAISIALAGWGFLLPAFLGVSCGRISKTQFYGWACIANVFFTTGVALSGARFMAPFNVAVASWCAWVWWRDGGGDGTRRRLKEWASRFQGVRRTAPSHA